MDRPLRLYAPLGTLDLWIELSYPTDSKSLTYVFGDRTSPLARSFVPVIRTEVSAAKGYAT